MFEWESYFEPHILERGWRYARSGFVKHLIRKDEIIEAVVSGSEYYKVSMRYDGHRVSEFYCSCPYAAEGNLCKHMAAVLYEADQTGEEQDEILPVDLERLDLSFRESKARPIAEIIQEADRSKLEEILLELAYRDDKIDAHIRSALSNSGDLIDISELKKEVDSIFYSHQGRGGYIDYYSAMDFAGDLNTYLCGTADRLLDEGYYSDAFDLTVYAFVQLGNCDIDDDGQIADVSNVCYTLWQRIITECSESEKERIRRWFLLHSEDGTVVDYMEDILQEFLRYELAAKEELQEEIAELDRMIEESGDSNKCKCVFAQHYGYAIEAIELRIILMRKIGIEEKEIDEFKRGHLHFQSVRKYYLEKAQEAGDAEEEIRLLKESKILDSDSTYLLHSYSRRLIDLFHMRNEFDHEKAERREDFLSYQLATVEDFREYRKMCSEDEWEWERICLIESRQDTDRRCELLAEEKMFTDLYELISREDNKLVYFNKYGFLLADMYAEQILEVYREYVSTLADSARSRSSYDQLVRYLKRMMQYTGGNEMVYSLCSKWIVQYPTRKVMVQELRNVMESSGIHSSAT